MRLSGHGVRCVRGGREVFSGLDFEAASGEALAVTGPNGSGKTSLLRLIAGLLTIADGSVGLEGGESELTLPEQAHYLGHRDALKPALSVLENLCFWQDFLGGAAFDAAERLAAGGLGPAPRLPAGGGAAPDLAAGRTDLGARCGRAEPVRHPDERSSFARRPDRRRNPRAAGTCRAGAA